MSALTGIRKALPAFATSLALAISPAFADEPQTAPTTAVADPNQFYGVAQLFSLVSQDASQQPASRPA